jgi:hypothetical protein
MVVQIAVHALLTGIREALTIWLALVALAGTACVILSAPARRGRPRAVRPHRTMPVRPLRTVEQSETEEHRYAEEVTVAADRATEAAGRWRAEWLAVHNAKDAAWRAYEKAEEAARRAYKAAAFPTPQVALTPDELASRERYLHRMAREAYQRGDLSIAQLHDALWHRNGWDPRQHPFEQQVILRRIALSRKVDAYRTVSSMERRAWEAVETAEAAKDSLRREARAAQLRARTVVSGRSFVDARVAGRSLRYQPAGAAAR